MTPSVSRLAPGRPAVHLSTPSGWLNDPNGLFQRGGVWHACYQHDPTTSVHGEMHWGHATSTDLLRWTHHPIALTPDEHGVIFSGSAVVDVDGSAGFGAGAVIAVFTHHVEGAERQSLAWSDDGGMTWTKFSGNPVLESDSADFRDPKVIALESHGTSTWVMCVAAGQQIEFYRSIDLRSWEWTGSYTSGLTGLGAYECPDLLAPRHAGDPWILVFGAVGLGPHGHSGTVGVPGHFDGATFVASAPPAPLDHGPDFYAAQTFFGAPGDVHLAMAWLNSWAYATTHPSAGWRGILSMPRRIVVDRGAADPIVRSTPAVDLAARGEPTEGSTWVSTPDHALYATVRGDAEITIVGDGGVRVATATISDGELRLVRHQDVVPRYAETYIAPISADGHHEVLVDHGTIEIWAGAGSSSLSALVFPGPMWTVEIDGDTTLRRI